LNVIQFDDAESLYTFPGIKLVQIFDIISDKV